MGHSRRRILWLGVTAHPTAEWLANQLTQAFGWERPGDYLIRDRDACYGNLFVRRARSLGIRDRPTSPRSPWQNGYAERLIGSIRRECLDHVVVFGERHLRHLLLSYVKQLQHCSNPPVAGERRASSAPCAQSRTHPSPAYSRWIASSIYPD
jgi:transposase InsO family protein